MIYTHFIEEPGIDAQKLDEKTRQTGCKKKYVAEFMTRWLEINARRAEITDVNFVDCMCGAGMYQDGELGIPMEALMQLAKAAEVRKDKRFNLFINDKDKAKTDACGKIAKKLLSDKQSNVNIFVNTLDVNDYLQGLHLYKKHFQAGASVVFIDPDDLGTVMVNRITKFTAKFSCDVIFNAFLSEYSPDGTDKRIRGCIGNAAVTNKDELLEHIAAKLKTGRMQHAFSYRFAAPLTRGLYQVIYSTPNIKGLEALKEALWETFGTDFYHRNFETDPKQLSLFAEDDDRQVLLRTHARAARELLKSSFAGKTVGYAQIETFLTERTMLRKTDFIRSALVPLLRKRAVMKLGTAEDKPGYRDDEYTFV